MIIEDSQQLVTDHCFQRVVNLLLRLDPLQFVILHLFRFSSFHHLNFILSLLLNLPLQFLLTKPIHLSILFLISQPVAASRVSSLDPMELPSQALVFQFEARHPAILTFLLQFESQSCFQGNLYFIKASYSFPMHPYQASLLFGSDHHLS